MKCVMCGRPLLKAAYMAGEYGFGPKCAKKLKGATLKRQRTPKAVEPDTRTLPLFGDADAVKG
jgi:hypothetical protein